jgi:hypothetical protein
MNERVKKWEMDWLYRTNRKPRQEQREILAAQLRVLHKRGEKTLAKVFRRWLLWVGVYPVRIH